jgi:hypothetical protein
MENQTTLETPSLRDQIESAVETVETVSEAPEVVESEAVEVESSEKPRDESGKFKKANTESSQESSLNEVSAESEFKPAKPRPSSWKKDYEESWGKLDPTLQDYITQRESDFAKGVSTYKNQWDQAQPILSTLEKFAPTLQQNGIDPAQWINNLGTAHQTLVFGNPDQKLQMFAQLANDYGVDLNGLTGGQSASPQFSMIAQELSQIKNQWQQFQSQQEQMEQTQLKGEIESFSKDKPYFDEVRETMAGLLQNNMASDLNTAYDKAVRLNDDVWQKIQSEQIKSSQTEQKSRLALVKAKAISPKSSSPTANMSIGGKGNNLRDQLASIVDTFSSENI